MCAVDVCSEAGADQSSISVCLGAAGDGLSGAAGLLPPLPRPAPPLTQHLTSDISEPQAGTLLQVGGGSSSIYSHFMKIIDFCSNALQVDYRCMFLYSRPVSYTVNQQHPGQILVQAQVVPLALELSTNLLVLRSAPPLLAQSGYRSSVTLRNHGNHAAEFTWRPIVRENGVLFSIRPATGTTSSTLCYCIFFVLQNWYDNYMFHPL